MQRSLLLTVAGVCLLTLLGCAEFPLVSRGKLVEVRGQKEMLQSRLQTCEAEKSKLLDELGRALTGRGELESKLREAQEKERELTQLLGRLQQAQQERDERLKELKELVKLYSGVDVRKGPEGDFIVMENAILFALGSTELSDEARGILDSTVVAYLKRYPDQEIRVDGHTDGVPIKVSAYQDNYHLSVMRAHSVMKHLRSRGIPAQNMYLAGFGPNRPEVEPPQPEAPVAENRRIEILLIPKLGQGIEEILKEFR